MDLNIDPKTPPDRPLDGFLRQPLTEVKEGDEAIVVKKKKKKPNAMLERPRRSFQQ
jgi:hypothetical protein